MASACISPQICHFDDYEEGSLGQCGGLSGGLSESEGDEHFESE